MKKEHEKNKENCFQRIKNHISAFWVVWLLVLFPLPILSLTIHGPKWAIYVIVSLFVFYLGRKPTSTVYALVGSSAKIETFLFNYLIITVLFSGVYWGLFFKNAGVCYDSNTPVLCYSMFEGEKDVIELAIPDTIRTMYMEKRITDTATICEQVIQTRVDTLCYHRITYWLVLKNTILTSLTQGPSDFFSQVSDFSGNMNTVTDDAELTSLFSIILVIHVLISWLFLGVFISLLYSKFRYEA